MANNNEQLQPAPELELIRASEVQPREIDWLWYPFIPYGKVTLLQGDPGDGKSTFILTIAALLTKGKPLPFTEQDEAGEPLTVIYQTTEDDADDTIVPRFIRADGDRDRLVFISEKQKALSFDDERIAQAVSRTGAKLLILDPLSSYIGDCQINAANEVRPRFNHLIQLAKETGCAVVVINHLNKMMGTKAIYRTPGSIDIVGSVRSALLIGRNRENEDERIMVQQKSNLAPTGAAIVFTVDEDGVRFLRETEQTADELLAVTSQDAKKGRPDVKLQGAMQFITSMFRDGRPIPAKECEARLAEAGIGRTTWKRAKARLGVHSERCGAGSVWHWLPPEAE